MKTKIPIKDRLIQILRSDMLKWKRYQRFLRYYGNTANLSFADLRNAGLRYANLRNADLRNAGLRYADLCYADLCYANLCYANLDFSCLSLSCKSLKMKTDERIRIQIAFHFASLIANADQETVTDEEKTIYASMLSYVNKFHRTDVERLLPLKDGN